MKAVLCPHIVVREVGDKSQDFCRLTKRASGHMDLCVLLTQEKCNVWNRIRENLGRKD